MPAGSTEAALADVGFTTSGPSVAGIAAASPVVTAASYSAPSLGEYECIMPYDTVANTPGGYAIGNCPAATKIYFTTLSGVVTSSWLTGRYFGGFVESPFNGCGWIYQGELSITSTTVHTGCGSSVVSKSTTDFIRSGVASVNCSSPCTDGTAVNNPYSCPAYANFRPWSSNAAPVGLVTTIPAHGKYLDPVDGQEKWRIRWRYIAKYTSSDGTGDYVMVRDAGTDLGFGNWVFVPRACLGSV